MPHIHIEYSANLEQVIDVSELCEILRQTASTIDAFATPGIRVRALRADHYAIADGGAKHGFVDIEVRIREGRSEQIKRDAIELIFAAAKTFLTPAMSCHSIALSAELRDIDAALSPKFGTTRDHLKERHDGT